MTGSGVESPSHWISRDTGSTPLGRLTLQLSVYEVPATPDPSPDTTTTTGGATTMGNSSYSYPFTQTSRTYQGQQVPLQHWVDKLEGFFPALQPLERCCVFLQLGDH